MCIRDRLRREVENVFCRGLSANEWIKKFAKDGIIDKLDRNMVLSLIDRINIYEDRRLEIIFNYEDEYKTASRIVENLSLIHICFVFKKAKCHKQAIVIVVTNVLHIMLAFCCSMCTCIFKIQGI